MTTSFRPTAGSDLRGRVAWTASFLGFPIGGLAATVKAGYAGRMRWSATREPLEHRVDLAHTPLAELREMGRRGDVVIGWV